MPPKPFYTDPDEMDAKIQEYFAICDEKEESYTVPGIALHLGFVSRHSLWDYANTNKFESESVRSLFSNTIKKALLTIEQQRVSKFVDGKKPAIPAIFDLKNNFNYVDKKDIQIDGNLSVEQKLRDLAGSREG